MSLDSRISFRCVVAVVLTTTLSLPAVAQERDWESVTGAEILREFMSGLTVERDLPGKEVARGEYLADGTGVLHEWGASFDRTWHVEGENQVCITVGSQTRCYRFERHTAEEDLYRARDVATGIAKTSVLGGRPWKMSLQYWYFVESPEAFGPEHQIRLVIGPVVKLPWKGRG